METGAICSAIGLVTIVSNLPKKTKKATKLKTPPIVQDNVVELAIKQDSTSERAGKKPPASASQALSVLDSSPFFDGLFGMSEWSERVVLLKDAEIFGKPVSAGFWDEARVPQLQGQLATMEGVEVNFTLPDIKAALRNHALDNPCDPVKDYLLDCKERWWKAGRPEVIESHLNQYWDVEDNVYTREVSAYFFLSAVARVMSPGCPVHSILILEGLAGIGKSQWAPALMPEDKGPLGKTVNWTSKMVTNKLSDEKAIEQITGVWICEMEEMKHNTLTNHNDAKAFITRGSDYRAKKYKPDAEDIPRRSILYGTTEDAEFVKNETGSRRWLPVKVVGFWNEELQRNWPRVELLTEDYKAMLWGEAMSRLPEDLAWKDIAELLTLSPEARQIHAERVEEKRIISILDEHIEDYVLGNADFDSHPMGVRRELIKLTDLTKWLEVECRVKAKRPEVIAGLRRLHY